MIRIAQEVAGDGAAREALLDAAFGAARFEKTCERLREGRLPARGLAFAAKDGGRMIGTLRFWNIEAGGVEALLLGPLAVDAAYRTQGIGGQLMKVGLSRAASLGYGAVILVGDEPYYRRFGFSTAVMGGLDLPGPVERVRFLGLELQAGALEAACGLVRATGRSARREARQIAVAA